MLKNRNYKYSEPTDPFANPLRSFAMFGVQSLTNDRLNHSDFASVGFAVVEVGGFVGVDCVERRGIDRAPDFA